MKRRDIILFTAIFCVLSLIVGSTYAYWQWRSTNEKFLVFNTSRAIKDYIIYDEGDSHFVGDFQPTSNYCGGMSNTLSFSLNAANMSSQELEQLGQGILVDTIKMDVNFIGSNISSSDDVGWVLVKGDSTNCIVGSNIVNEGSFKGVSNGDVITLLSNQPIIEDIQTFTVWIWISNSGNDLVSLSGDTLDVNVWSQIDMLDASLNVSKAAGLYDVDGNYTSWDDLVANGDIVVSGTEIVSANTSLSGDLVIPRVITEISTNAFYQCSGLTDVVIPKSVKTINAGAFTGCSGLTNLVVPEGVTKIETAAFQNCSNLTTISLPATLISIGVTAFDGTALSDIYYGGTSDMWSAIAISSGNEYLTGATIHYNS